MNRRLWTSELFCDARCDFRLSERMLAVIRPANEVVIPQRHEAFQVFRLWIQQVILFPLPIVQKYR